jgi:hypothetical protein
LSTLRLRRPSKRTDSIHIAWLISILIIVYVIRSKLRVLYEVAPIGYLIEKAGGKTSEGSKSVLDIPIETTEQVSQVAFGSPEEVKRFEALVGRKYI